MNYHCPGTECAGKNSVFPEEVARAIDMKCPVCWTDLNLVDVRAEPNEPDSSEAHSERDQEIEDLIENLPTLLAMPLAEFERESNPVLALWAASDLMEVALKLCVMAGLAEHDELSGELQSELRDKQLERPTMGNWMGMAETVIKHLLENTRLPELVATVENLRQLLGPPESTPEEGLLAMRNRLAHGGPCKRKEAERLLGIWEPRVRVEVIQCFRWLIETQLLAQDASKELFLLRGEEAVPWKKTSPLPPEAPPGSAWLIASGEPLSLGPLGAFDTEERVLRIYVRREEVRLQYLRLDNEGGLHDSGPEEVDWFKMRFRNRLKEKSDGQFVIRPFESEIRKESARRIGREPELNTLLDALHGMESRFLWVGGPAGIGKSNLMASAMAILLDDPPSDVLLLPYLFRAGDDRCGRMPFLRYVGERLQQNDWLIPEENPDEDQEGEHTKKKSPSNNPVIEVRDLLLRLREGTKALLLLDGLDEIAQRDEHFMEDVVFGIANDRLAVAGAARSEHGIPESFHERGALDPFPNGLPPMSEGDVRAFLLERAGNVRKRLLNIDKERGEETGNKFFAKVAELSEGLPIYLNCLIGDLHKGTISPENTDSLPRGIHAYHEELLRRQSVGDLQAVTTPALVTLALAHEPLTPAELTAFLKRFNRIGSDNLALVERALSVLGSMIRRAPDPDGEEGYTIYHHSLREHVLGSEKLGETVSTIRKGLAEASLRSGGDTVELYLLRCGIRHLLEGERIDDAIRLMTDFEHTLARFQRLDHTGRVADDWYADWERLKRGWFKIACVLNSLEGSDPFRSGRHAFPDRDTEVWWDFARTNRHHFCKEGWESWRVLFQAAMDHADDSPITLAAEQYFADGNCDWYWLRWDNRPKEWAPSPLLAVLQGHKGGVHGVLELTDGRILSWSFDGTLRMWDGQSGKPLAVLEGHGQGNSIWEAMVLNDGRILSCSSDHTLRLWDGQTGEPLAVLEGHTEDVDGVKELSDGRILSRDRDGILRLWDGHTGEPLAMLEGHTDWVNGAEELSDGRILSWSFDGTLRLWDGQTGKLLALLEEKARFQGAVELTSGHILSWGFALRLWDGQSGKPLAMLEGHTDLLWGAEELSDGRILSWSYDGTLRLWNGQSGEPLAVMEGHSNRVGGAKELQDERILSWSDDNTLRIWDGQSGDPLTVLEGHLHFVLGAEELSDGRILSWSRDGTLRLWDGQTGERLAAFEEHPDQHEVFAQVLRDGRILSWSYDCTVRIWDNQGGQSHATLENKTLVTGFKVLTNGRILSWSWDSTLQLWNGQTGKSLAVLEGHTRRVIEVTGLAEGRILSRSWDGTLRLWDGQTGEPLAVLEGHTGEVSGAEELSDGRILSWDKDGILRLWDGQSGEPITVLKGHTKRVNEVTELADGRILSCSSDRTLRLWDGQTGEPLTVLEGHSDTVAGAKVLRDGRILSRSDDRTLRLWDGERGEPLAVLEGHTGEVSGTVELSDGRILSWSQDTTLRLWDGQSGKAFAMLEGHTDWVCGVYGAVELSDGRILSWSEVTLRLWDGQTGEPLVVLGGHTVAVSGAEELSDGRILSWDQNGILRLWDRQTGELVAVLKAPGDWTKFDHEIREAKSKSFLIQHRLERPLMCISEGNLLVCAYRRKVIIQRLIEPL